MSQASNHINQLRDNFSKGSLHEKDVKIDPSLQFEVWINHAVEAEIDELQAMTLSTIMDNKPSSRIVYLRKFHNHKFWFYGNYNSKKGKSMEANPNICINFFWPDLQRQIRIEGTVKKASADNSDNYFDSRPEDSKIGAWASAQSEELNSRKELESNVKALQKKFKGKEIPRPDNWGGWVLKANFYEFWQGRDNRLHDRITYQLKGKKWEIIRLAP